MAPPNRLRLVARCAGALALGLVVLSLWAAGAGGAKTVVVVADGELQPDPLVTWVRVQRAMHETRRCLVDPGCTP